jgi:hypothetical protein
MVVWNFNQAEARRGFEEGVWIFNQAVDRRGFEEDHAEELLEQMIAEGSGIFQPEELGFRPTRSGRARSSDALLLNSRYCSKQSRERRALEYVTLLVSSRIDEEEGKPRAVIGR